MGIVSDWLFELDDSIQYVGLLDTSNTLLESKFRDKSLSLIPGEVMQQFARISPLLMLATASRLDEFYGETKFVMTRFEKRLVVFYRVKDRIIVVVLDRLDLIAAQKIIETITHELPSLSNLLKVEA
jgi:hypothetical protein